MKPVYTYTFNRAFFKTSTFIIIGFALVFPVIQALTFDASSFVSLEQALKSFGDNYYIIYWLLSGGILLGVFTGMKATSFVADELEDGTFLTVISKPISRFEIIIGKYLAILTTVVIYIVAITFIPFGFLSVKVGSMGVFTNLLGTGIKITLYAVFFVVIVMALILPLSIKISSKIVVALSIVIPAMLIIIALVLPIILGVGGFSTILFAPGGQVSVLAYNEFIPKQNLYNIIRFFDIPSHFSTMFSYAANSITTTGGQTVSAMFGPPRIIIFKEVLNPATGQIMNYIVQSKEYALNPIVLYVVYGLIAAGLSWFTVRTFTKEDFM